MDWSNRTVLHTFTLLGFTKNEQLNVLLFLVFFFIYIITLLGNISMLLLITKDIHLHTPMYFFLGQLSFLDSCYSSVISPKMLVNFLCKDTSISSFGCAAQMFFFVALGTAECFLLALMAYDRYVAICKPLSYIVIMTRPFCIFLVAGAYIGGFLHSVIYVKSTFELPFCKSHDINHFFCDVLPLLKLSCIDTTYIEALLFAFTGSIGMSCLVVIIISYMVIISSVLNIQSAEGRMQTFSTCTSHITAVSIYFGTILFMYLRPHSSYNSNQDRVISVFYTIIIPFLNPIIYSIRNKSVKIALKKALF
ncbi:olfactory receptor-like protein OLF1 [Spea bombifrons]|uniref:olfactory receptor-like protein OLF1 n=1 Tax=Spea bombifrons TaxID=233779 RepID=UPI00234BD9A0|nr:olfactory receptor-like protein OLF1 [Spea bombifrons]